MVREYFSSSIGILLTDMMGLEFNVRQHFIMMNYKLLVTLVPDPLQHHSFHGLGMIYHLILWTSVLFFDSCVRTCVFACFGLSRLHIPLVVSRLVSLLLGMISILFFFCLHTDCFVSKDETSSHSGQHLQITIPRGGLFCVEFAARKELG